MGIHSCTGPMGKWGVADCNTEWGVGVCGELGCSSTFAVRMFNL